MLIDTFRLRCDDDYTYGAHNHGIYGNDPPSPVFRDFLARAKAAGMLPQWWNEEKEKECERMAMEDEHLTSSLRWRSDAECVKMSERAHKR
jgi:splicing suppressor protein 51